MIDTSVLSKVITKKKLKYKLNKNINRVKIINFEYEFKIGEKRRPTFLIKDVLKILSWLNGLKHEKKISNSTIYLNLGSAQPVDNLTITFLEYVCYYAITNLKYRVIVNFHFQDKVCLLNDKDTLLKYLRSFKNLTKTFIFEYEQQYSKYYLSTEIYKRAFNVNTTMKNSVFHSKLNQEIYQSLGNYTLMNEEQSLDLSETITELVENAIEHGQSDCFLTIYSPNNPILSKSSNAIYHGVDVSLFNISKKNMGDDVLLKLSNNDTEGQWKEVFDKVDTAHSNHKKKYNLDYDEESFGMLAAMQLNITGRAGIQDTGGTGLPKMIKSLQESAYLDNCYVISGRKGFWLCKEYLDTESDGYLSMNENHDFINEIPNKDTLLKLENAFPGTGYHLSFVFERG